jgi:hypothetical protein
MFASVGAILGSLEKVAERPQEAIVEQEKSPQW